VRRLHPAILPDSDLTRIDFQTLTASIDTDLSGVNQFSRFAPIWAGAHWTMTLLTPLCGWLAPLLSCVTLPCAYRQRKDKASEVDSERCNLPDVENGNQFVSMV
jgi:hypothetical protein